MTRSRHLIVHGTLIFALLSGAGIGLAQPSGEPDTALGTASGQPTVSHQALHGAAPDGERYMAARPAERPSASVPGVAGEDDVLKATAAVRPAVPLWARLEALDPVDRANARVVLELADRAPASARSEARAIDDLWNSGAFPEAIGRLRALEESGLAPGVAAAVTWRRPRVVTAAKWLLDRQVSPQMLVQAVALDFDAGTGNQFVATAFDDGDPGAQWSVNFSSDNGLTWSETYAWYGEDVPELHARVVAGYFWVAYVATGTAEQTAARVRRFTVADGLPDNAYFYTTAFDNGVAIEDLSVETNADAYDNRAYVLGLLADDTLIFHWTDPVGTTWHNVALAVTDAESDLDAHWNTTVGDNPYFLFLSYRSTLNVLHVVKVSNGDIVNLSMDTSLTGSTAIAAYEDHIMVACENTVAAADQISYRVSYDGGNAWLVGSIVGYAEGRNVSRLDLAARGGGGFACVYGEEVGEPDRVWYTRREYGSAPGLATWIPAQQLNDQDLMTGKKLAIEYLPPTGLNAWAHGVVWPGGDGTEAYYDRDEGRRLATTSIANAAQVSVFTVPDGSGDPLTNCYLYGGARTNATITVRVTDENGNTLGGVPAENVRLRTTLGGLQACADGAVADAPTNSSGITTFTQAVAGGNHSQPGLGERTRVYVDGYAMSSTFNVQFNSPDANGDLQVSLADIPAFAAAYAGAYDYAFDFRWDGDVNLSDIAPLAGALGAACSPIAASSADELVLGTLGIYFDEAASQRSRDVAPGEEFEAYLIVTGPAAAAGVRGWQCELSLSGNVVVRDYVYAPGSLNLLAPPRFLVGTAAPCPTVEGGGVRLLTLRLQVTDEQPAFIHLNREAGESGDIAVPLVALGAEARLAALERAGGSAPGVAVASINDPAAGGIMTGAVAARPGLTCAPNPFNPITEIRCRLAAAGPLELSVFDAAGRRVARLASGHHEAGEHVFRWTGHDDSGHGVGSGIYFARLETTAGTLIEKLVLLR